jgi:hypothetical protein
MRFGSSRESLRFTHWRLLGICRHLTTFPTNVSGNVLWDSTVTRTPISSINDG